MYKIAVIQFPGSNCELETARAIESAGLTAELFRWNDKPEKLKDYAGYVLGGGFSYQDRVRAGVIAAKEPIMEVITREAEKNKPILGICNGAQILVESGLVPGLTEEEIEIALAHNVMSNNGHTVRRDYYCNWVYLKASAPKGRSAFNLLCEEGTVFPIPIAHAEGRFTTRKEGLLEKIEQNNSIIWQYVDENGKSDINFPTNPNGSMLSIAGLSNPQGNVLAMMPHPERANWLWQVPSYLPNVFSKNKRMARGKPTAMEEAGPGRHIFLSMKEYLKKG